MPTVELTVDQVVELVKRLPEQEKLAVLQNLRDEREAFRRRIQQKGQEHLRRLCAQRGLDWDVMTEEQRLAFVDDLLHEDR
jgi:hypothetical protein